MFLKDIPIPKPTEMQIVLFGELVALIECTKNDNHNKESLFLEALIDACVMEIYFADHMAEKNLSVIAEVNQAIQSFHETVTAPNPPIHNRLMRIPIDSPDLLRVIQEEGKV